MSKRFVNVFTYHYHWLSNDSVKWLDNQIIWYWISSLCLIIKGIDNQVQKLNNQSNQYPPKSLIVNLELHVQYGIPDSESTTNTNQVRLIPRSGAVSNSGKTPFRLIEYFGCTSMREGNDVLRCREKGTMEPVRSLKTLPSLYKLKRRNVLFGRCRSWRFCHPYVQSRVRVKGMGIPLRVFVPEIKTPVERRERHQFTSRVRTQRNSYVPLRLN